MTNQGNALADVLTALVAAPFLAVGLWLVICGLVASYIASTKGRNSLGFFLLAFAIGPFAIAVAILATPISAADRAQPRAPRQGFAKLLFGR